MKTNQTLGRLYALYPSIGAWAKKGDPGIWADADQAKLEAAHYAGPNANSRILECYGIRNSADIEFVKQDATYNALCLVIEAVYNRQHLRGGLFREDSDD